MHPFLEGLWTGDIRLGQPRSADELGLAGAISLPADVVYLDSTHATETRMFEAGEVLEPGLQLADVLAEEFDIFVEDDTLVLVSPTCVKLRRHGVDWCQVMRDYVATTTRPYGAPQPSLSPVIPAPVPPVAANIPHHPQTTRVPTRVTDRVPAHVYQL